MCPEIYWFATLDTLEPDEVLHGKRVPVLTMIAKALRSTLSSDTC